MAELFIILALIFAAATAYLHVSKNTREEKRIGSVTCEFQKNLESQKTVIKACDELTRDA